MRIWFLTLSTVFMCSLASAETSLPTVDFKALPGEHLQGSKLNYSELKGNVVLVDFWAAWCEPCKEALPHYNKIFKKYKDQGLIVIGMNEDDDKKERETFLKSHTLDFPIYHDTAKQMIKSFNVQALPSLFVFDRSMKLVALYRGFKPEKTESLEKKIQELLAKK